MAEHEPGITTTTIELHEEWTVITTEPRGWASDSPLHQKVGAVRFDSREEAQRHAEWLASRHAEAEAKAAEEDLSRGNEWHLASRKLARTSYHLAVRQVSTWVHRP